MGWPGQSPVLTHRAFREHILILYLSLRGVTKAALHCAHRATTASSWGLSEQEGRLATPRLPS
jgi:hypothetical protein